MNQITEKIEEFGRKGAEMLNDDEMKARLNDFKLDMEEKIRQNPVPSMLIAVAAGYLLGKMFGGR
jgi:hypothetical protein